MCWTRMSFRDIEAGGLPSGPMLQDSTQALASIVFQINTAVSSFKGLVNSLVTDIDTPVLREKLQPTPVVEFVAWVQLLFCSFENVDECCYEI